MSNKIAVCSVLILGLMIVPGAGEALAQNAAQARQRRRKPRKRLKQKLPQRPKPK